MAQIPNPSRVGDMPSGEPFPEGTYNVRLDKADFKLSKDKKIPMAECAFTVFGPASAEEFHGRKVFENLMLEGEGRFRTRQLLEETGEDDEFVLEDTDQLVGREVGAVILVEPERTDTASGKKYGAKNKIHRFTQLVD